MPPAPIGRPLSRREARDARRRQHRRRLGAGGLVAVGIGIVAVVVVGFLTARAIGHHAAAPGRTQSTLLLLLRSASGSSDESVLLAHDSKAQAGVEVLIPGKVITDVPGFGSLEFGQTLTLPGGAGLARDTLADLMGITVDGTWVLDRGSFARLVDAVGGVSVTVDREVLAPAKGGGEIVVVPAGQQHLNGAMALAYSSFVASGEDQTAALARLQSVLDATLGALPRSTTALSALVRSLGGGSQLSFSPGRLATFLTGYAADLTRVGGVFAQILPVLSIDTGGPISYRVDDTKLHELVTTQLADSIPTGGIGAGHDVLVKNGVGTPGLDVAARAQLIKDGFRVQTGGNQAPFGRRTSVVLIFDATPQAAALGDQVAQALGLPSSDVEVSTQEQSVADIIVILGEDFRP
ncbi:MAG TPA: LCP family protein [Mycobacteriales bacterium]|nr:LCP family protein [Mycobacteriales bacterium]